MSKILFATLAVASCVALSGCAGFTVPGAAGGSVAATNNLVHDVITDPNCGHHDEVRVNTGAAGVPASATLVLTRDCPARPAAAPAQVAVPSQ
jgi:hypothetical protein